MGTDGKVRELVNIHVCMYTFGGGGRFKTKHKSKALQIFCIPYWV